MTAQPIPVQIPANAILPEGADLAGPIQQLLRRLALLGDEKENDAADGFMTALQGPPQSVALIEAGATAASKWWATGLGTTVVAAWSAFAGWWSGETPANQRVAIWAVAIITAAAVLGIAYLLATDVRGRGMAAAATIRARAQLAVAVIQASESAYAPTPPAPREQIVALSQPLPVNYLTQPADNEAGWQAVALLSNGKDVTKYLVINGGQQAWVDDSEIAMI
jgi:hypothetical protein